MISFLEETREGFGVEPISTVLPIAPSTWYSHAAVRRNPSLASLRAKQDILDKKEMMRVFEDSTRRYGTGKVWHSLRRVRNARSRDGWKR